MNTIVNEAIRALRIEADRVNNKEARERVMKKIVALTKAFQKLEGEETAGPPGKAVVRNKNGKDEV